MMLRVWRNETKTMKITRNESENNRTTKTLKNEPEQVAKNM
jgi:hypothetical protein